MPHRGNCPEGPRVLTEYQERWLRKARLLNRLLWGWITFMGLLVIFIRIGLPPKIADVIGYISLPIPVGFLLFVFLNSCPKCDKNFYSRSPLGPANAFTTRCLNCGLTWKLL